MRLQAVAEVGRILDHAEENVPIDSQGLELPRRRHRRGSGRGLQNRDFANEGMAAEIAELASTPRPLNCNLGIAVEDDVYSVPPVALADQGPCAMS